MKLAAVRQHGACSLHRYHWPRVPAAATEEHHVQPRYLGGADVPSNKAWVCANCHNSVHLAITAMVEGRPVPEGVSRAQLELARRGYLAWVNGRKAITDPLVFGAWRERLARRG